MRKWAKKLVVIVGLALLALFGGGEVGVLWASRLCVVAGEACPGGAAYIGGFVGMFATIMVLAGGAAWLAAGGDA